MTLSAIWHLMPQMGEAESLRARKKERTRQALSHEALALFRDKGFERTTIDDIAAAADVSRRTFFRYYPTKEAVLFPWRAEMLARFRGLLAEQAPGAPPFAVVKQACLSIAKALMDQRAFLVAADAVVEASPALIAYERELDREWEAAMAAALLAQTGADALSRRRARVLAGATMGAIRAVIREWFDGKGKADLVQLGADSLALLETGMAAFEASSAPPDKKKKRRNP